MKDGSRKNIAGGPEEVPVVADPPAPGAIPPAGVPWSGPERLRADPSLGLKWLAVVVAMMAVGVVVIGAGRWQLGAGTVGAGMIVGGLIRAFVPSWDVGLLQVRSKPFDVTVMLVVGAGIIVMVLSRM